MSLPAIMCACGKAAHHVEDPPGTCYVNRDGKWQPYTATRYYCHDCGFYAEVYPQLEKTDGPGEDPARTDDTGGEPAAAAAADGGERNAGDPVREGGAPAGAQDDAPVADRTEPDPAASVRVAGATAPPRVASPALDPRWRPGPPQPQLSVWSLFPTSDEVERWVWYGFLALAWGLVLVVSLLVI